MYKKGIILLFLILIPFHLAAFNGSGVIPLDSPLYDSMKRLYAESALALPSGVKPWSENEALFLLERIDPERLSKSGLILYKSLKEELGSPDSRVKKGRNYDFEFQPVLSPEVYAHTNEEISASDDWVLYYEERRPFLGIPLEGWLGDTFYGGFEVDIKRMKMKRPDGSSSWAEEPLYSAPFLTNLPSFVYDDRELDYQFVFRAQGSAGGELWQANAGRDDTEWGWGRTGNLLVGDHFDYTDRVSFSAWSDAIKYTFNYEIFDDPTHSEIHEAPVYVNAFIGHRFEYRLWPWLSFNLTEGLKIKQKDKALDLRYFSPLLFLHNLYYYEENNNIMEFGIDAALPGRTSLTLNTIVDQYQHPEENAAWPPLAFGALASLETVVPLKKGALILNAEFVYTSPYLYLREEEGSTTNEWSTGVDWIVRRQRSYSNYEEERFYGYHYGPDSLVYSFNGEYSQWERFSLGTDVSVRLKGEKGLGTGENITFESSEGLDFIELSGVVDHIFTVGIYGEWNIYPWLSVFGRADYTAHSDYQHIEGNEQEDIQVSAGFSLTEFKTSWR